MRRTTILTLFILLFFTGSLFAGSETDANHSDNDAALCLIEKYNLAGEYLATITPKATFFAISQAKTDVRLIKIENNVLQLQFADFHTGKMPYAMTVVITMTITESACGKLKFKGMNGLFRAVPVDKNSKRSERMSKNASIKGCYLFDFNQGRVEDFSFVLNPRLYMPVRVHIDLTEVAQSINILK